jgi:two-component system phosphate regulon sensor histidine kinase PhoR
MFSSIWWRITLPYTIIILVTTLGLTFYLSSEVREARLADLEARLLDESRLMAEEVRGHFLPVGGTDVASLREHTALWSSVLGERVTIIGADGIVLAESHADPDDMENHLFRPEIQQALDEGVGTSMRFSQTLRREVMYAAVAVEAGDAVIGFTRLALPLEAIEANVNQLERTLLLAGGLTAFAAVAMSTYVASRTTGPIRRLTETVDRMASGDLTGRLMPTTRDEVGSLMRAFNHMVDQLEEKVATLALERSRLSTVLEHMADGVIITDEHGVIVLMNAAAARILRYNVTKAVGRRFAQVAYSHQLIELWNRCYETQREQNETVETVLYGNFLHAVITPLRGSSPPRFLVMLQDLTHIRRLETIRRDFISNISHELRTPLASLSLVVETLRDGAIEDPPAARRFLSHMQTELAALTQMVEELLELSRIESGRVPLAMKSTKVKKLIHKPVKRLRPQAERKGVALNVALSDDLPRVRADAKRIHQVVTNLVHNAIKFTPSGGAITAFARVQPVPSEDDQDEAPAGREVVIGVTDTGVGIPEEDLGRIFERFYKTDRARTREGTGLGLAIAKHIVQGHQGRIWVESIEGVGSTFFFSLPVDEVS